MCLIKVKKKNANITWTLQFTEQQKLFTSILLLCICLETTINDQRAAVAQPTTCCYSTWSTEPPSAVSASVSAAASVKCSAHCINSSFSIVFKSSFSSLQNQYVLQQLTIIDTEKCHCIEELGLVISTGEIVLKSRHYLCLTLLVIFPPFCGWLVAFLFFCGRLFAFSSFCGKLFLSFFSFSKVVFSFNLFLSIYLII